MKSWNLFNKKLYRRIELPAAQAHGKNEIPEETGMDSRRVLRAIADEKLSPLI
jgi:hypothetical protein